MTKLLGVIPCHGEGVVHMGFDPGLIGLRHHLAQQPALPDARRTLDDQNAPAPLRHRRHQSADHLQLARPSPNRGSCEPLVADVEPVG